MSHETKRPRRGRRWIWVLAGLILALTAFLLAMPLWFPWVLRPALAHYGVHFERYERLGWGRWAVENARYGRAGLEVEAGRLESPLPFGFLLGRWRGETDRAGGAAQLELSDWRVEWKPDPARPDPPAGSAKIESTEELLTRLERFLPPVHDWVRSMRASEGVIILPGQRWELPSAQWREGSVRVTVSDPTWPGEQVVTAGGEFPRQAPFGLSLHARPAGLLMTSVVARVAGAWTATGRAAWEGNRAWFTNRFDGGTWWPSRAELVAENLTLPEGVFRLEGYRDVTGTLDLQWRDPRYVLEFSAVASPTTNASPFLPPARLTLQAEGDIRRTELNRWKLETPWGELRLDEGMSLAHATNWLQEPVALSAALDLSQLPRPRMSGLLRADFQIIPTNGPVPAVSAHVLGESLKVLETSLSGLDVRGHLAWPRLEVVRFQLDGDHGAALEASADLDLSDRTVRRGRWSARGPWLEPWLPEGLTVASWEANGTAQGAWTNLAHAGRVRIGGLARPPLKPMDVDLTWAGEHQQITNLRSRAVAGESELTIQGALLFPGPESRGPAVVAVLETFDLSRAGRGLYALTETNSVSWTRADRGGDVKAAGSVSVDGLEWSGPDRSLLAAGALRWPRSGRINLQWRGVHLEDARDWIDMPEGEFVMRHGVATGQWEEGPMEFDVAGEAEYELPGDRRLTVNVNVSGDGTGMRVGLLEVYDGDQRVAYAGGRVPVQVVPSQSPDLLLPAEDEPIDLSLALGRAEDYWKRLTAQTGVRVIEPEVSLTLSGSLGRPSGRLTAKARRIEYRPGETNLTVPAAEDFVLELAIQEKDLRLERCGFLVQGQKVTVSGHLPLGAGYWERLTENWQWPDWKAATADVRIEKASLASLAESYSGVVNPEGFLDAHVRLRPGGEWSGVLTLTNAGTRPFPPLGPVRDIQAEVTVSNRTVRVRQLSGHLGGQEVTVTGEATFPAQGAPEFMMRMQGTNVPLVRQPGLVLRSDLDLRLQPGTNGAPVLAGDVHLRDSLFLQNLEALMPGNLAKPSQRPPYFSVEAEPLRDWGLNVKVRGERFLQMRNPLFRGKLSASLDLQGTLGQPVAYGTVRVDEGRIQFPFATLNVDQGLATLSSRNPYVPDLLLFASGQNYGYRVRMDVEGNAMDPRILFSSSPPLRSEEIILMMTAGEIPRDTYQHTGTQKTSRAAMFLGRDLISRFSRDRQTAERLTIRSGEHVSSQGELTYYIEYKLNERWSLVGEYDRFNAINAGLKWRLYSK